jgi:hypothetical protein
MLFLNFILFTAALFMFEDKPILSSGLEAKVAYPIFEVSPVTIFFFFEGFF